MGLVAQQNQAFASVARPFSVSAPEDQYYSRGVDVAGGGMSALSSAMPLALPVAGMLMGGRAGRMLDPFTGALAGFGRGVGWQAGAGFTANIANIGSAGLTGVARGIGGAMGGALPGLAIGAVAGYGMGEMLEGSQFHGQVSNYLQNQFRFVNNRSRSGRGFSSSDRAQISQAMMEIAHQDVMTTPGELLGVMKQGASAGTFRGVEDAREFRRRFKEMTTNLRSIAQELNSTLADAMPVLSQARKQGFWTTADIQGYARNVQATAYATGLDTGQVQRMMGAGAQMSRSLGGGGQQGAQLMSQALQLAGTGMWSGRFTGAQMAGAGFGTGQEAVQNFGQFMARGTARFARSRYGRYTLAALMSDDGSGLDPERLRRFMSGNMSVGEIGRTARENVGGEGGHTRRGFAFRENEQDLRAQLMAQGPGVQVAAIRGRLGEYLHGDTARDRLITRRVIQRMFGGTRRQAGLMAQLARDFDQVQDMNVARTEGQADAQGRTRDQIMHRSYEGMKRRLRGWWDQHISGPLQKMGSRLSHDVGRAVDRVADRLFGRTSMGALDAGAGIAYGTGSAEAMATQFGEGELTDLLDPGSAENITVGDYSTMRAMGYGEDYSRAPFSSAERSEATIRARAMRGFVGSTEAKVMGFGSARDVLSMRSGVVGQQLEEFLGSTVAHDLRRDMGSFYGGQSRHQVNLAGQYVSAIQGGAGGSALQGVLGGDRQQAITRLMALQTAKARGLYAGLKGPNFGDTNTIAEIDTVLSKADLVMSREAGGVFSIGSRRRGFEQLRETEEGQRALKLFARAAREGDETYADRARAILGRLASGKEVSEEAREVADALRDPNLAATSSLRQAASVTGVLLQRRSGLAFPATTATRMDRLRKTLGDAKYDHIISIGDLGDAIENLVEGGGEQSARDRAAALNNLAKLAMESPEEAIDIAALMSGTTGGAEISLTLQGAAAASAAIDRGAVRSDLAGGRSSRRAMRGGISVGQAQGWFGKGLLSSSDLRSIIKGDVSDTGRQRLRAILESQGFSEDEAAAKAESVISTGAGGWTEAEMRKDLVGAASARGRRSISQAAAKRFGFDDPELARKFEATLSGRESPVEALLKASNTYQQKIAENTTAMAGDQSPNKFWKWLKTNIPGS